MKKTIFGSALLLVASVSLLSAKTTLTVGIVADGSKAELVKQKELFITEIKKVSEGEFDVRFPITKQLSGDNTIQKMDASIDRLENDPDVDMVLLIGGISSQLSLKKNGLRKPTFAPFIYNVTLSGLKRHGDSSKIANLNYLTDESVLDDEIEAFRRVAPFTRLSVVADASQYRLFSKTTENSIVNARKQGIVLNFVTVSQPDEDVSQKIPSDTQAVMIAPLPTLNLQASQRFYAQMNRRKIPTYALGESGRVKDGILLSLVSVSDEVRRARSMALNMLAVMRGEKAEKQPVLYDTKRSLLINMATARAIGVSPKYSVLENAVRLNEIEDHEPKLTLASVAEEAIRANLGIIAGKIGMDADKENVSLARSVLFPQVSAELSYAQLNRDNVYVESGFYAQKSTTGALRAQQILFSEKALANLEIQKELHIAVEEQQRTLELEVVKQASTLFLNMLVAQTYYRIQSDNLSLTRNNLELAKGRVQAGTTDMSDVYYWESTISTVRQNLLQAGAEVEKAKDALNMILDRKIDDRFMIEAVSLNDPDILRNRDTLLGMLNDNREYRAVENFLLDEGFNNSPELARIKAQMAAQKRQLLSEERSYYTPDVALGAEVSHVFDETRNPTAGISLEDKTDWQAGLKVSLPLYEGGGRSAKTSQARLKLQQLQTTYTESKRLIEQRIRSDLHSIGASYPSIALAMDAAVAARKSFDIIRENYAQGTRSMSDLLTAQNSSLVAEQAATNTLYHFMIDIVQLQRDIGSFDLLSDRSSNQQFLQRMRDAQTSAIQLPEGQQ